MPTLLNKMALFVTNELNRRVRVVASDKPVSDDVTWMHGKSPWIKMQSNATFVSYGNVENKFAGKGYETSYILYGGWLNAKKSTLGTSYDSNFRPFPGIIGLDSCIKGGFGMMRELKVKFKAYNLHQLEILQGLYMTPGIGVLVEWGWSAASATISTINLRTTGPFKDDRWLGSFIRSYVEKGHGRYDAMFGLVSNFNISMVDDGTFDCETTIFGPGSMTVDLNLQSTGNSLGKKLIFYFENAIDQELQGKFVKDFQGNKKWLLATKVSQVQSSTSPVSTPEMKTAVQETTTPKDQKASVISSDVYVSWEFVEATLNKFFNEPVGKATNAVGHFVGKKFINSSTDDSGVIPVTRFMGGRPKWRSLSPQEVLIHKHPSDFVVIASSTNTDPPRNFDTEYGLGDLRSVWLNYNSLIRQVFDSSETMREALDSILGRINGAMGGIWDLQAMHSQDDFSEFRVVDFKCNYGSKQASNEKDGAYVFDLNKKNSIIRDASLSFNVPNALKSTVMITANAPGGNMYSSVTDRDKVGIIKSLTIGVRDRFADTTYTEPPTPVNTQNSSEAMMAATTGESKASTIQTGTSTEKVGAPTTEELINKGNDKKFYEEFDPDEREAYINKMFEYMEQQTSEDTAPLIPAELSITIDGIGGVRWGDAFKVSYLPERYIKNAVFQVKDITHSVTVESWTTTIVGLMRPRYKPTVIVGVKNTVDEESNIPTYQSSYGGTKEEIEATTKSLESIKSGGQ